MCARKIHGASFKTQLGIQKRGEGHFVCVCRSTREEKNVYWTTSHHLLFTNPGLFHVKGIKYLK